MSLWVDCLLTSADILHTLRRISKEAKQKQSHLLEDLGRSPLAGAIGRDHQHERTAPPLFGR
jgi:hypothetical protein